MNPRRKVLPISLLGLLSAAALAVSGGALAFDADSDGLSDEADAFPCNSASAAVVFAPAQGQHGFMLFEDQWPSKGDNDFNDVAVAYNYIFELTASGQVRSIRATYNLLAVGGIYHNGLALQLPVPAQSVASVRQSIGQRPAAALSPVVGDPALTLRLLDDVRSVYAGQEGPINSDPSLPTLPSEPIEIEVRFSTPQTINTGAAPFDLFIFRTNTPSYEIHRPEFSGTGLMDQSLFHTQDDASSVSRHFVDSDGLPYALNLPHLSPWSREGVSIEHLYPNILPFAASAGTQHTNFYEDGVDLDYAYGWTAPDADHPVQGPSPFIVSNWTPPTLPVFVGPSSIPSDTGCVNAWGLSVQFGTSRDTFGYDGAMGSDDSLVVTGYTTRSFPGYTNHGAQDIFVAKYNRTSGALVWSKQFGGSLGETGRSIAIDAQGNIYIAGETGSSFDSQTNAGQVDAFLMKLDSAGNWQWTRFFGGSGYDYATSVAVDTTGGVYLAGGSSSSNLPGGSAQGQGPSSFIAKFDSTGARQWTQQYKTDSTNSANYSYISDISVAPGGTLVVTGSERRFGLDASSTESPFVAKHSTSTGASVWVRHLGDYGYNHGSTEYRYGHGLGVSTDNTGAIYMSGTWEAGSQVSQWGDLARTSGDTSADFTLVKLSADGTPVWSRSLGSSSGGIDYGQAVQVDPSTGAALVVGYTSSSFAGQSTLGGYDYFVARYDTNGARQWIVQNGTSSNDGAFAVALDASQGNVYMVGNSGFISGTPSAYQSTYFGFVARHAWSSGALLAFNSTVDTSLVTTGCKAILAAGASRGNGVYTIDPDGTGPAAPVDVYCDMTTNGGGWTLVGHSYNASAWYDAANLAMPPLKCGGGTYSPTVRSRRNGAIPSLALARNSTEIGFGIGGAVNAGPMTDYTYASKFNIPNPAAVTFDDSGYAHGVDQGPCTAVTVTSFKGDAPGPYTRYTYLKTLSASWTDSYPTGYGATESSSCVQTHVLGPFVTNAYCGSGRGSYTSWPAHNECGADGGRYNYTYYGNRSANTSSLTGDASIWLR